MATITVERMTDDNRSRERQVINLANAREKREEKRSSRQ
jgi:hypothetical protein